VIVNADASQVYRDLRVLTARPDAADEARAEHRLFGYVDAGRACSAAAWAADAKGAIAAVHAQDRLPILVGGTGLYIRTLLHGIAPVPEIDPGVRATARALPVAEAHAALTVEDPTAAARLAATDTTRVIRALEVVRSTGRTLADWQAARTGGIADAIDLRALVLDPPRDTLYARCDSRVIAMFAGGAVDEVAALLARCLDPGLPAMRAIGVIAIAEHLAGRSTRAETIAEISQKTRNYAKRQATWLRHQIDPDWPRLNDCGDLNDRYLYPFLNIC
jgi:tRNA dimethylallyltransferase